jgi:hypothetical protein
LLFLVIVIGHGCNLERIIAIQIRAHVIIIQVAFPGTWQYRTQSGVRSKYILSTVPVQGSQILRSSNTEYFGRSCCGNLEVDFQLWITYEVLHSNEIINIEIFGFTRKYTIMQ